ncbi:RCC1/BLIP-II protein [Rhodotorula sp. JG-1b]|nr:RCC1/BLIP-II protein [Rhodotorula sp. JG-1b]
MVVQAGVEDLENGGYTVQDIAATWETSFFLLRPGDAARSDILLSTGANDWGERGRPGADPHIATRIELEELAIPGERGAVIRVVDLQAGPRHVVALLEIDPATASDPLAASTSRSIPPPSSSRRRVLVGWGASRQGQLGCVERAPRITATPQPVLLPPPYQVADVCSFSLGKDHTALLLPDARGDSSPGSSRRVAVLLGSDKHGQLGLARHVILEPPRAPSQQQQQQQQQHTKPQRCNLLKVEDLFDDEDALDPRHWQLVSVHCTWNSTFCHLERRSSSPRRGSAPTAATSSRIVAFGHNAHGQLGVGTTTSPPPAAVPPNSAKPLPASSLEVVHRITQLSCGSEHVLALLETGEVIGWGWNEHGNLGLGSPSGGKEDTPTPPDQQEGALADVWEPRRVWPQGGRAGKATSIEAGNATSWIFARAEPLD